MIKIKTYLSEHVVKPTIFPDGTSQVWKLPEEFLEAEEVTIVWNFEAERELVDLMSLRMLLSQEVTLHMPYLPFGRQDKEISNDATFNLQVLAHVLNSLNFTKVTTVDAHNPHAAGKIIEDFHNIPVGPLHSRIIEQVKPNYIVYPDYGASLRYKTKLPTIVAMKVRDQATGKIMGHELNEKYDLKKGDHLLIVDDICDGGATFISVADMLHRQRSGLVVDLFVTHGIFSKGRQHLLDNGIHAVYTTNSLLHNTDGYGV
jgi:ribose-phosphate pyrophosphokinase